MQQVISVGTVSRPQRGSIDETPAPGAMLHWPTIAARSGGVSESTIRSLLPHTMYAGSPDGTANRPTRLALLETPAGRVLTHAVAAEGQYFAHTLLNVPETADAQLAIQTWGSPQWQRSKPDSNGELPELPYLPVADRLDDGVLKEWLVSPDRVELLEFVLSAWLTLPADEQIALVADADDVANVVYALTRVLPANLLERFTFSTYESDVLGCKAKLVGHSADGDDGDLPDSSYRRGAAFNTRTGKRSDRAADHPYAKFAGRALAEGKLQPIDDLKSTWQRLGLKTTEQFDLVVRLARGTGSLTKAEAAEALQHPPLAAWVSARADALNQFLDWALEDRAFAATSFVRAVQSLRQKPDVLAKVADRVREAGSTALKSGDVARAATAWEVVLPMVAPTKANSVWGELLADTAGLEAYGWDARKYLLPKLVRYQQQAGKPEGELANWFDVPAERLADVLALDVPKAHHLAACRNVWKRDGQPDAEFAATLSKHPALVQSLLQAGEADRAKALFERLLDAAPQHGWFEDALAQHEKFAPERLNAFFEASLQANKLDSDRLVRTQGPQLLELFAGQSGLDRLGEQFLAKPPADALKNPAIASFFDALHRHPGTGPALKERIESQQTVRSFLADPAFDTATLENLAKAFVVSPTALPDGTKNDAFDAAVKALQSRRDATVLQTDLEAAMVHAGATLATGPADLFENVLRAWRTGTPDFAKRPEHAIPFLAIALGANVASELDGQLDGLDGQAFAVATDAAKHGGCKQLDEIDAASKQWPREAQAKWGFLHAAVRPKPRWQRDLAFAGIGAGVGAAVALLVKLFV